MKKVMLLVVMVMFLCSVAGAEEHFKFKPAKAKEESGGGAKKEEPKVENKLDNGGVKGSSNSGGRDEKPIPYLKEDKKGGGGDPWKDMKGWHHPENDYNKVGMWKGTNWSKSGAWGSKGNNGGSSGGKAPTAYQGSGK